MVSFLNKTSFKNAHICWMFLALFPDLYLCVPRLGWCRAEQTSAVTEVPGVLLASLAHWYGVPSLHYLCII